MRRGFAIIALLVLIFGGIGIGVGAYRAGERNGITEGIEQVHVAQQSGQEVQVVHVVGRRAELPSTRRTISVSRGSVWNW